MERDAPVFTTNRPSVRYVSMVTSLHGNPGCLVTFSFISNKNVWTGREQRVNKKKHVLMGDNGRLLLYSTVFYLDRDDTKSMGESTKLRPDSRRITQYVSVRVTSHPAASRDVSEAAGHVHLCLTPPQTQHGHNATATAWWFPVVDPHSKILDVHRLPLSPNFFIFVQFSGKFGRMIGSLSMH